MIMTAGLPTASKRPVNCRRAGRCVDAKRGDRVALLVARIQELAAGIDGQATRIVGVHPVLRNHAQLAVVCHRENCDGIVQPIGHVEESAVCGDDDFRGQVAAAEFRRQRRHELLGFEAALRGIVIVDRNLGVVLVEIVENSSARMKYEMARRGTGRRGDHRRVGGQQPPALGIEAPDQGQIESRIIGDDELPARIRRDHVNMRTIVIADRELSGRIVHGARTMACTHARPHVGRLAQRAVGRHRENGHVAAAVVGDEYEFAGGMHAGIGGTAARRAHGAQSLELQGLAVDGVRDDGAIACSLIVVDFADRIQAGLRRVGDQPGWISNVVEHLQLRQGAARFVQAKQVDTAAVGRVGADIGVGKGGRRRTHVGRLAPRARGPPVRRAKTPLGGNRGE